MTLKLEDTRIAITIATGLSLANALDGMLTIKSRAALPGYTPEALEPYCLDAIDEYLDANP